jgi:hypothetical protein
MSATSLAALERKFRKLDSAFDDALTSRDAAAVARTDRAAQGAHDALYAAVPRTLQDVVVVLRCVIGGMRASGDPLCDDLIPRARRLRVTLGRTAAVTLGSLIELRAIAFAAKAVCSGDVGETPWISQWLEECAACLSRPQAA